MDTHGHEAQSVEVGMPLLEAAFTRAGKHDQLKRLLGEDYLYSLYLGNWLTDVSQGVDPVAYAGAETKALAAFDQLVAGLMAAAGIAGKYVRQALGLDAAIEDLAQQYRPGLQSLFAMLQGGADSDFAKALTKAMKVKGYLKFVHPEQRGGKVRLKYPVYKTVFEERFTQYFPHEHLDRWPDALDLHGGYTRKTATRTRTLDGPPGTGSDQKPHVYQYLVDHIEIAAGLTADVDLWARHALAKNAAVPNDPDEQKEWGRYLAKFGHALHACEDFFAHSNFIEHAYQGRTDAKKALDALGIKKQDGANSPWVVYNKRLNKLTGKRAPAPSGGSQWQPDIVWHEVSSPPGGPGDETEVVTGTFDFQDTLHSLQHVAADLGGDPNASGAQTAAGHATKGAKAEKFSRFLGAICRGVLDRSRVRGDTSLSEADAKRDAQALLGAFATSHPDGDVKEIAQDFADIPAEAAEIRDDVTTGIALLTKHTQKTPAIFTALELYLRWISSLLALNVKTQEVVDKLPDVLGRPKKWIKETISDPLGELIQQILGRYRIGCHSLIAKDYEWHREQYDATLDKLYWRNIHCSTAVHWYIVKTMVRWSEPIPLDACRAEHGTDRTACATVNAHQYLDWHELLEFFLRHPHGRPQPGYEVQGEKGRWWWNVVEQANWKRFSGLPAEFTDAKRSPKLPHKPVYFNLGSAQANRAEVEKLRDAGVTLRGQAESFYNDSLKKAGGAPPMPSPKSPRTSAAPLPEHEKSVAATGG